MSTNGTDKIIYAIDSAIKEIWINEIKNDLNESYILYEDTLKNAFYFHLRNRLNSLLEEKNIRIFTEFHDGRLSGKSVIADIAIVQLGDNEEGHIKDNVEKIYAIIELKYKGAQVPIDPFLSDVKKTIKYIKDRELGGCQFYLVFIHEGEFNIEEKSWIQNKKQKKLVQGRLTELSACYYEGQDEMTYTIISYNDMNKDLNTYVNEDIY